MEKFIFNENYLQSIYNKLQKDIRKDYEKLKLYRNKDIDVQLWKLSIEQLLRLIDEGEFLKTIKHVIKEVILTDVKEYSVRKHFNPNIKDNYTVEQGLKEVLLSAKLMAQEIINHPNIDLLILSPRGGILPGFIAKKILRRISSEMGIFINIPYMTTLIGKPWKRGSSIDYNKVLQALKQTIEKIAQHKQIKSQNIKIAFYDESTSSYQTSSNIKKIIKSAHKINYEPIQLEPFYPKGTSTYQTALGFWGRLLDLTNNQEIQKSDRDKNPSKHAADISIFNFYNNISTILAQAIIDEHIDNHKQNKQIDCIICEISDHD